MRVGYIAPLSPTGYSDAARGYIRALDGAGVDVDLSFWTEYNRKGLYGADEQLMNKLLLRSRNMEDCEIVIHHSQPDIAKPLPDKYNIAYTVFEANIIPPNWTRILNESFQEVWVPSEFNVNCFYNSGVRIPVTKIPHIVNAEPFQEEVVEPVSLSPGDFEDRTIFLFVGTWDRRKNPDDLLAAYYRTFSPDDMTLLVCRTHFGTHGNEPPAATISRIKKSVIKDHYPPVMILGEDLPQQDIIWLHQRARAFTSLAHSEGWGLCHSQSLAAGVPVISINWGGSLEFQREENSFLINPIGMGPVEGLAHTGIYNSSLMSWGYPDVAHAGQLMWQAWEDPDLCTEKGRVGQKDMQQYSLETIGSLMKGRLRDISKL